MRHLPCILRLDPFAFSIIQDLTPFTSIVRHSAVVLSKLRRGARTREAERLVTALYRLARMCWEPTAADWWEAGRLIRKIGDAEGWDRHKRRDFQNDALIALTARCHGATVVTANRSDCDVLARELRIHMLAARA
jgi:predicted nucleic acid-binding protein